MAASIVVIWVLFTRVYILVRFGQLWSEWDTGVLSVILRSNMESGSLVESRFTYSGGPGYPAVSLALIQVTGIDMVGHQLVLSSFLGVLPVAMAFLLYRRIFPDSKHLVLASVFLLSLFSYFLVATRDGTHDKYSISLMLLAFVALLTTITTSRNKTSWTAVLILGLVALATYNVFVSTALAVVLLTGFVLLILFSSPGEGNSSRLPWQLPRNAALGSAITASLIIWLYPPSFRFLRDASSFISAATSLVFGTSAASKDLAYGFVTEAYTSMYAYAFLSAYQWAMIGIGGAVWTGLSYLLLRRSIVINRAELLTHTWFGAFGIVAMISLSADLAMGSHWQLRVFGLGVVFIPPMALMVLRFLRNSRMRSLYKRALIMLSVLGIASLPLASTLDPILMNANFDFEPGELVAMEWLGGRDGGPVYSETNARLHSVWNLFQPLDRVDQLGFTTRAPSASYVIGIHGSPPVESWYLAHQIYDGGGVNILFLDDTAR